MNDLEKEKFVLTYRLIVFKWVVSLSIDIYGESLEVLAVS